MVFGEINSILSILEKLRNWCSKVEPKPKSPVESVAARFIRLFESHGVHRNQIPRFFGHGLLTKDVQDDVSLLPRLDEEMLEDACSRFAVRREWLDGAEEDIHPLHDFYKYPKKFQLFIEELIQENPQGQLEGVLIAPVEDNWGAESLLLLQEVVGHLGDRPIYRFHLCNNWAHRYWKARGYLTACIAIAWKRKVYIHGVTKRHVEISPLASGKSLLGWAGEGIWSFGNVTWHPKDMALHPEDFLKDITPERNNFGIKSALKLWLELEGQGHMESEFGQDARELFNGELTSRLAAGERRKGLLQYLSIWSRK
jgi:hypothetical protein